MTVDNTNMPSRATRNAASASNRSSNTNTANGVPEHRTAPTPQTHMTVAFGWGSKYLLPLEAALDVQRVMSQAIRIEIACNLAGSHDLWVRSQANIDVATSYVSLGDEYVLDRTVSDADIVDYIIAYRATRELGGDEAVAGLTFAKSMAENGVTP